MIKILRDSSLAQNANKDWLHKFTPGNTIIRTNEIVCITKQISWKTPKGRVILLR